ncbi:uncharacterized protein [Musca autumnalis]|uniref:uncharacterized protein n=1 Tax=Musca autumnalis TaxID=221902 RepID=UPI003CECDA60
MLNSLFKRLPKSKLNITTNYRYPTGYTTTVGNRYISKIVPFRSKSSPVDNERIGGLPLELINKRKLETSSRTLSTLQNPPIPPATRTVVSTEENREFLAVFPEIVNELREVTNKYNPSEIGSWFGGALEYNIPHGKLNRGLLTVLIYKNLVESKDLTPEKIKKAQILGWCVEIFNGFILVYDDVMDNSLTRRGQVCWHKVPQVGLIALNDALMLENGIYVLLKKHFSSLGCYIDLMELFHEITFITACGQSLDMLSANNNVLSFSMEKFNAIAANKTAYYTFYFPFALAMHLAGIKDPEAFRQSKTILLEMGHFFQVQNDFLDCFGNPEVTGKIGTDIQDNKCTWLAVVCMQRANEEQKQIMLECYGQNDPEKIQKVKDLYISLGLPNAYATYEEDSYNMIKTHIQQTSRGVPHGIFTQFLNKIYKRVA